MIFSIMDRRLFSYFAALCIIAITSATDVLDDDLKETENIECKQDGFLPHPTNCRAYYWCSLRRRVRAIILECEQDEIFDTQSQKCTYPSLSTRKECGGTKILDEFKPRAVRSPAQIRNQPDGCTKEEFIGDNNDCSKFYRCVDNGGGQFARYEFSCAPGTVWDSDISSCNHAWAVKSKCGKEAPSQNYPPKGEYEENPVGEQPYPIKNPDPYPMYQQQLPQGMQNPDYGGYMPINYPPQPPKPEQPPSKQPDGNDNPNPNYEQPPGGGYYPSNEYNPPQQNQEKPSYPLEPQPPSSSETPPPVIDNEINSDSTECQMEGFLPDSKDCRKFYRCVENGKRRFMKYEFTCGPGTVWDAEINACNHEWAVKRDSCKSRIDETNNGSSEKPTGNTDENSDNKGPGGEESSSSSSVPTEEIGPSTSILTSTEEPYSSVSTEENTSISTEQSISIGTTEQNSSATPEENPPRGEISYECTRDGFIPDKNDCRKFYRCVQNEKRGFVKYEFSCGQGTVWDPDANTCNFPWATRNKCGKGTESNNPEESSNSGSTNGTESSTEKGPSQVDSAENMNSSTTEKGPSENETSSTTEKQTSSESNEGSSTTETSSEIYIDSSTNTTPSSETLAGNNNATNEEKHQNKYECTNEEDFIPDKNDCKKFYRCVKGGAKGFTKYEFSCGQGTVWDPDTKTCNYPWATRSKCGAGGGDVSSSSENTSSTTNSGSSTTESSVTENKEQGSTENQQSSTSAQSSSTTEKSPDSPDSNVTSSVGQYDNCISDGGFIGDSTNCKKFYRCVADGNGGLTKYEFMCGDGTVWDSDAITCNYPWAVKGKCGNSDSVEENGKTTGQPEITTVTGTSSSNSSPSTTEAASSAVNSSEQTSTEGSSEQSSIAFSTTETTEQPLSSTESSEQTSVVYSTSQEPSSSTDTSEQSSAVYSTTETTQQPSSTTDSSEQSSVEYSSTETTQQASSTVTESSYEISSTESENKDVSSTESSSEQSSTTETTSSTEKATETSSSNQEGSSSEKMNKCTKEGFFPNIGNCNKFYRCVSNGQGGYTKYDFDCGGGTIWDPDLDTCNFPYAVKNKICEQGSQQQPKGECTTGGYFPSTKDCKGFYRCVDSGNGQYVKYEFKCGNGTIWDPNTLSCNHPWVTVNKACGHRGDNTPPISTSANETKTEPPKETVTPETTGQETITTTVTNEQTTIDVTTESEKEILETSSQTSEPTTTTVKSEPETITETSSESTETSSSSTETSISTDSSSTEFSTSIDSSSTETATSIDSAETTVSVESSSTPTDSSSTETSTAPDSSTTETSITSDSSSTETNISTDSSSTETSESTSTSIDSSSAETTTSTDSSSTETSTTAESFSTESSTSTDISSTETSSTTDSSTESLTSTDISSTETSSSTDSSTEIETSSVTETSQTVTPPPPETNQTAPCPISQLEGDQMALVCPTGFKRHPKYCNLFYQCTSNPDTFEINVLVISCPGRRIYDDSRIQCLPEEETDQPCTGQIAETAQLRKFGNSVSPMEMEKEDPLCPNEGNFPLHPTECNENFIKCEKSSNRKMRGFMYQCPENYSYWPVSKKCEKLSAALPCEANLPQERIWQIPVEVQKDMIDVRFKD